MPADWKQIRTLLCIENRHSDNLRGKTMTFFLQGLLIGLLFGVPAGAVGALTVYRTLKKDIRAGLVTGFGSSVADCFYACIGAFGLTMISDFLSEYENPITFAGGCLIIVMGIRLLFKKEKAVSDKEDSGLRMFLTSFAAGITNPAAVLTFLFAFSWFGISGNLGIKEGSLVVFGIFAGTYIWWGILSFVTALLKRRARNLKIGKTNRVFGTIFVGFGIIVFIRLAADIL